MKNRYLALKEQHQKEVNAFPMVFAFDKQQFERAMQELGLTINDTDKIYSISGGGYIRKTDSAAMHEMFDRHRKEIQAAIDADTTGDGFIYEMFDYELANHEYGYTRDVEPTLEALSLTIEEVNADKKLKKALDKARKAQKE